MEIGNGTKDTITRLLEEEAYRIFEEHMIEQQKLTQNIINNGKEINNHQDQVFGQLLANLFAAAHVAGTAVRADQITEQLSEAS